jgi:hypothetical protein
VVALEERTLRGRETSNGKEGEMSQAETSERKDGNTRLFYSGRAALRREQYNGFDQRAARQQHCKHSPTRNHRGSFVFILSAQLMRCDVTQQLIVMT